MKTLCAALLLAVSSQTLAFSCKDVKPLTTLDVSQLKGKWNIVEVQAFTNGEPTTAASSVTLPDGPKLPRCVQTKLKVYNESSAAMKAKIFLNEDETLVKKFTFSISDTEKGRWGLISAVPARQNEEYLILAANPDKYVVIMKCHPGTGQPSTDRSPVAINFLSRTPPRDVTERSADDDDDETDDTRAKQNYVPVTEDELKVVRSDVAKLVGLTNISPVKLDIDCFQKKQ